MINKIMIILFAGFLILACSKTTKPSESVATPTFNPVAGTYITPLTGFDAVKILCATSGAVIRYTTDGTDPTTTSTQFSTGSPLAITQATTFKARAYKEGLNPSAIATAEYAFTVSSVTIYPITGSYSTPQTVQIQSLTPGTIIHYTLDGTEPTETSSLYTGPFIVNSSVTLKAKGFIEGWIPSATATVVFNFNIGALTISPLGGTFTTAQTVTITSTTPNTVIHYTTDGSAPTVTSSTYTAPVTIDGNTTLKARGFITGWNPSSIASADFVFNCLAPTYSMNEGTYNAPIQVGLATSTPGAQIRYTTDGTTPTETSALYSGQIDVNVSTNFKARTFRTNWNPSGTVSAGYTLKVITPTFNPGASTGNAPLVVTITTTTPGATIYYTTNGDTPTESSNLYDGPVTLEESVVLKAKAYKAGWSSSDIYQAIYNLTVITPVTTPVISPVSGTYTTPQNIYITCATTNVTIRYTLNGSEPTASSTEYTSPFVISDAVTVKAKAFRTNWPDSQTATESYVINFTLGQMISVPGGMFFMGNHTASGFPADEAPEHQLILNGFSIGKYEVTQIEWFNVMNNYPSFFAGNPYNPVETISWYEALVYCNKRSLQESLTPAYTINGSTNPNNWQDIPTSNDPTWNAVTCNWTANGYRLPTEAEWEYAAGGAMSSPDYIYAGSNNALSVAWFRANSQGSTQIMGHLQPNQLSINDMSGNVYEWCWDWYLVNYYSGSPNNNPTGPDNPSSEGWRVTRGGDWDSYNDDQCRLKKRTGKVPYFRSSSFGLRVVRSMN